MKKTSILLTLLSFMIFFSCSEKEDDVVSNNPKDVSVTSNAEVLSYSRATLKGYANGANGEIGFCYSSTEMNPTPDNAMVVKATSIMADNSYSVTLTRLRASTTYYYRAYATKDGLAVLAKDVKTFQTEEIEAITSNAEVLSCSSATLNGYTNCTDGEIGFCYSSTEKNPTPNNATVVIATSIMADNSYSVTLTQLRASTTYYYRAYATKDGLTILAKDVKTFQTEAFKKGAVDLGLPSGLKWANCNVGATSPEDYGAYFAWGETEPKDYYGWNTYKWCRGSHGTQTKYCTSSSYGTVDSKTVLDPEDDAAHVNWGGAWRMPTRAEQDELQEKCTWTMTTQNGVNGYKVTGPNGNAIFLPAAGFRYDGYLNLGGFNGHYWSSSLYTSNSNYAYYLYFDLGFQDAYYDRYYGLSVRPVCQ